MAKIVVQYPDEISVPVAIGLIRAGFPQATGFAFITDWVDEDAEQQKAAAAKLDAKAQEVVELIRPTKEQWQRQRFLRQIWLRLDSLAMSGGESEASPRGISAGLSRTLRPLFPNDSSPLDALFPRTRVYDKTGHFMGVRYNRTALGKRVLEILAEEGTLGEKPDLSKLLAKS